MTRYCSWCKKYMGEKPGGSGITDGICDKCKAKLLAEAGGQDPTFSGRGGSFSPCGHPARFEGMK